MFTSYVRSRECKIVTFTLLFFFTSATLFVSYNASRTIYSPAPMIRALQAADTASSVFQIVSEQERNGTHLPDGCTAMSDHIYFLKTHKCGSSTVQNILMRRGLRRGLNFVLPERANYLGHPDLFDPTSHIGKLLRLPSELQQYDIFTHHSRYHAENVQLTMPTDTKRVTIVREPAALYESLYNYYRSDTIYDGLGLDKLLKLSSKEMRKVIESKPRFGYRIGINQMSFDMGLAKSDFLNSNAIKELIETIQKDFDLVMVSEYMEASLVLLAELMCWPLEDVAFVTINARSAENRTPLSVRDAEKLNELNSADAVVYAHFQEIFKQRVIQYGVRRMEEDVTRLITLNNRLFEECIKVIIPPKDDKTQYSVVRYQTKSNSPVKCEYLVMSELPFTDFVRNRQISRFKAIRNLHEFLAS